MTRANVRALGERITARLCRLRADSQAGSSSTVAIGREHPARLAAREPRADPAFEIGERADDPRGGGAAGWGQVHEDRSAVGRIRAPRDQAAPLEPVEHAGEGRRPLAGGVHELANGPARGAAEGGQRVRLGSRQAEVGELGVERCEQAVGDVLPVGDEHRSGDARGQRDGDQVLPVGEHRVEPAAEAGDRVVVAERGQVIRDLDARPVSASSGSQRTSTMPAWSPGRTRAYRIELSVRSAITQSVGLPRCCVTNVGAGLVGGLPARERRVPVGNPLALALRGEEGERVRRAGARRGLCREG